MKYITIADHLCGIAHKMPNYPGKDFISLIKGLSDSSEKEMDKGIYHFSDNSKLTCSDNIFYSHGYKERQSVFFFPTKANAVPK